MGEGGAGDTRYLADAAGCGIQHAGMFWFLDRMVWLFEDMRGTDPMYERQIY